MMIIILIIGIIGDTHIIVSIVIIYVVSYFAKHSGFQDLLLCRTSTFSIKHFQHQAHLQGSLLTAVGKMQPSRMWSLLSGTSLVKKLRDAMFTSHTGYHWGYMMRYDIIFFFLGKGLFVRWTDFYMICSIYLRNEIEDMELNDIKWSRHWLKPNTMKWNEVINLYSDIQPIATEILLLNHLLANLWMIFVDFHLQSA